MPPDRLRGKTYYPQIAQMDAETETQRRDRRNGNTGTKTSHSSQFQSALGRKSGAAVSRLDLAWLAAGGGEEVAQELRPGDGPAHLRGRQARAGEGHRPAGFFKLHNLK